MKEARSVQVTLNEEEWKIADKLITEMFDGDFDRMASASVRCSVLGIIYANTHPDLLEAQGMEEYLDFMANRLG